MPMDLTFSGGQVDSRKLEPVEKGILERVLRILRHLSASLPSGDSS
jgi:hypothetical protein